MECTTRTDQSDRHGFTRTETCRAWRFALGRPHFPSLLLATTLAMGALITHSEPARAQTVFDAIASAESTPAGDYPDLMSRSIADSFDTQFDAKWRSRREMSIAAVRERLGAEVEDGYLVTDIESSGRPNGYALVSQEPSEARAFRVLIDLPEATFDARGHAFESEGYRPHDVDCRGVDNGSVCSGIWVWNREGRIFKRYQETTWDGYERLYEHLSSEGLRPIDFDAYRTEAGMRYASVWVENAEGHRWEHAWNLDRESYEAREKELAKSGFRTTDFESYWTGSRQHYAAIWEEDSSGLDSLVMWDLTEQGYRNVWRRNVDRGLRLIDFEEYEVQWGTRYAGVWVENRNRYRLAVKEQIDDLVLQHLIDWNIPGMSVAVVQGGQVVYRRGFGAADRDEGKEAHGRTVYLSNSISKAIGATLAARLADLGRLSDGTPLESSLVLSRTTRSYLPEMPTAHEHTVEQLLRHTGCVKHYSGHSTPKGHYRSALEAAEQLWETNPKSKCDRGVDDLYSTHAYTYVGAVLEKVAGRSIARLVGEEIGEAFGLSSMRALYETAELPYDYERATPYKYVAWDVKEHEYEETSWKVLGGGIETTAIDLAMFGWLVLDGAIVSPSTRDNVLWAARASQENQNRGLGWSISGSEASHGGSRIGWRSQLRVFRNKDLAIAVMSNRRRNCGGDCHNLTNLTRDIAALFD